VMYNRLNRWSENVIAVIVVLALIGWVASC
jgi:hypothetical protein